MADPFDWEMEDEDAHNGPDAILDGEDELENDLEDQTPDEAAEALEDLLDSRRDTIQQILAAVMRARLGGGTIILSDQARALLANLRVRQAQDDDDDDDDDLFPSSRPSQPHVSYYPEVTEPQAAGVALLQGGEFGHPPRSQNIYRLIKERELIPWRSLKRDLSSPIVPNTNGLIVARHPANVYSGQFSADSSFYYTCRQDFTLHVYDPTAPPQYGDAMRTTDDHISTMKVLKTISGVSGGWTITDSHLSPNNQRMIYSAMSPIVYMTQTLDDCEEQIPLNFSDPLQHYYMGRFAIWSCRFSADGREIIAGGSSNIFVYDLGANRRTVKILAHQDDVNSCCWADSASGNVLISASDDSFIKVWDRRSLSSSTRPSGVLIGHTEGITYVSSKGDGRYVISNGKDQALRLWDLRQMRSNSEFEAVRREDYGIRGFDYRSGRYPRPRSLIHPHDCSVMTYRGHSVLKTLIRCHFSPMETTGSRYVYSGSHDGKIHIWSLDGRIVDVLDRSQTAPLSSEFSDTSVDRASQGQVVVRDVAWSSSQPVIMSCAWEGRFNTGSTIARHEFRGFKKMGGRLEDVVDAERENFREPSVPRHHVPGAWDDSDL